ncbi:sensor histidine kinase [Flavobacterium glaciei]|uniref:histidine kinase n=1 Tax=Flavobacterium glaciei TaxID=386300 RepID=A0A562PJL1_9FLAO|nr:ATP-binding protein [Flavobacterium glaciei]RDI50369.1 histidine kinase/DNA gyrase B/HSP90-like ATPase [Flavobacterium glaciei]TWI44652.1 histidine kinase/DNA gyrase B/HSP90-like ATPase [Flavobacterium glaciei]
MNSLIKRQINKFLKPEQLKDIKDFLVAVNDSYNNFDDQLAMSQRAMRISSDELFEANQKLREEAQDLKEINKNLEDVLNSMNLDVSKVATETNFNTSDFVKKQALEIITINKQREQLLKSLEEQNRELNEYAHVVSHDLKAPLRNIYTLVNWVIEDNKDQMGDHCLTSLNSVLYNVEKMDVLIKGILEYSTIDKIESEDRLIDFNVLCDETVRTLFVPNTMTIKIQENLPKVFGNTSRFKQVFQNLIQNAINYSDKDNGIIEVGYEDKNDHHLFYIKDNGIGINPKYFERIFKVFTKLESNNQSSGIGLSIVKKIVHYYKGEIWVESQENMGSTFYFTLPK